MTTYATAAEAAAANDFFVQYEFGRPYPGECLPREASYRLDCIRITSSATRFRDYQGYFKDQSAANDALAAVQAAYAVPDQMEFEVTTL